jgi:hypothetical protein
MNLHLCRTSHISSFSHSLRVFPATCSVSSDISYLYSDSFDFLAVNACLWSGSVREHICVGVLPPLVIFGHPGRYLTSNLNKHSDYVQILGGGETAFQSGSTGLFSASRGPSSQAVTTLTLCWYHLTADHHTEI